MAEFPNLDINNQWIRSKRGSKNPVDPEKPYTYLVEKECNSEGIIEDVATIFLTNEECPFSCLMCDLWKNTIDKPSLKSSIPDQIRFALEQLPDASSVKLYNSGSFFDVRAIPVEDYPEIASQVGSFKTVIVESHPKFINDRCLELKDILESNLEIAIGLETIHPDVLPALNKKMNLDDFKNSIKFLKNHDIQSRAFILLNLPFLSPEEGVHWAKKSLEFAFDSGVDCCVIIPTRTGNGALDWLEQKGYFIKPTIPALEEVLDYGLNLSAGRVFADLWDIEQFSKCDKCLDKRIIRMSEMNQKQELLSIIQCTCNFA